jgi:hypothetical protein
MTCPPEEVGARRRKHSRLRLRCDAGAAHLTRTHRPPRPAALRCLSSSCETLRAATVPPPRLTASCIEKYSLADAGFSQPGRG